MNVQVDVKALESILAADYRKPLGTLSGTVKVGK